MTDKYNSSLNNLIDHIRADWDKHNDNRPSGVVLDYTFHLDDSGRNYDKVFVDYGNQRSVVGFVVKKDNPKKGFAKGDILKAASWKAPATNFSRGNIFTGDFSRVRWSGVS
jgi:hypothetical protein